VLKYVLFVFRDSKNFEDILPRVTNTLKLCFNPGVMVPEIVTNITGLSNDLLENQSRFKPESVNLMKIFLENLPQPISLVAHNGLEYDYPLMKAELVNIGLQNLTDNVYIVDSLTALKHIFNKKVQDQDDLFEDDLFEKEDFNSEERRQSGAKSKKKLNFDKPPSFSLPKLHDHIFGVKPKNSHGAEADVHALIRVCASQAELFVEFAQKNYDSFKDVKKMW
jgi:hypothetical protein